MHPSSRSLWTVAAAQTTTGKHECTDVHVIAPLRVLDLGVAGPRVESQGADVAAFLAAARIGTAWVSSGEDVARSSHGGKTW